MTEQIQIIVERIYDAFDLHGHQRLSLEQLKNEKFTPCNMHNWKNYIYPRDKENWQRLSDAKRVLLYAIAISKEQRYKNVKLMRDTEKNID